MPETILHKGHGHRKRLRQRFLESGLDGFLDYEIIELLLTLGTPRKDCKQMAKESIEKFGSLANVLDADYDNLQEIKGIGSSNAFGVKLFQAVSERYSKEKINQKKKLNSPKDVFDYLKNKIGREQKEHFAIIFLDTKNQLVFDTISIGTLNSSLVHPREVFKKAIRLSAEKIIVAHNHPSGDSAPSETDIITTKRLVESGKIIGVTVADHIIICRDNFTSFKKLKLI